jgi:hypothetical protein
MDANPSSSGFIGGSKPCRLWRRAEDLRFVTARRRMRDLTAISFEARGIFLSLHGACLPSSADLC